MTDDLIGRAEAQTAIQFAARRYTVAHEAHGEGQVVWSDNLINVTDAMNVLRDLPSAEPYTTTHDSIPAETGKNDGDGTSGDCISRQQAIDMIKEIYEWHDSVTKERIIEHFKQLPSAQPDIIRCKDCKYYREYGYVNGKPKFLPRCTFSAIYVDADDFCSKAERREDE